MRICLSLFLIALAVGIRAQQPPPEQPTRPTYTALITDVSPEIRQGRTFVPVRAIAQTFGATLLWDSGTRQVRIAQAGQPNITLTIGSRTATVGTQTVTLDAAPFITRGRTMAPLRFVSETYDTPIEYRPTTRNVLLYRADRIYVLPLESTQAGVEITDPRQGELVRSPIRVQGFANVFEGALIIEVRDSTGRVLGRTIATAGMGGFYPFSTTINYNLPSEDAANGRIIVFSQNGRGNGQILAQDSVEVVLASTI